MLKAITSTQNKFIKQLTKLKEKSRERKKTGQFIIEGFRELELCVAGAYQLECVLFVPDIVAAEKIVQMISTEIELIEISLEVYHKLAYRDSTEGVITLARSKNHTLDTIQLEKENPLILVAESPEKPGNIGAILRTADAASVDAVLIANPTSDLYNPNSIRSSVGCVFTNQIAMASSDEIIAFLKAKNIAIFCAALTETSENYLEQDYTSATAIVVGTEATGLTEVWLEQATQNIVIPMRGKIDSMNVSVATGILIFEAVRQRSLSIQKN